MGVAPQRIAELATNMRALQSHTILEAAYSAGISPNEYQGHGATVFEMTMKLAEVAAQRGPSIFEDLERQISNSLEYPVQLRPLHQNVIVNFGKVLGDLLDSVSHLDEAPHPKGGRTPQRLVEKLNNAQINGTLFEYAVRCRRDMAFIKREAEKLGFKGYSTLQKRLQSMFVTVVEQHRPREKYSPADQCRYFIDFLFERCVPADHQELDNIEDLLAGVIFDTVAHCVIRWD